MANEIQRCQMSLNAGYPASPDKYIQFDYTLHQQKLEQAQSAKYLGLTITDDLDWGQHISEISAKATKTMGFLRHTKEVAYKTLVRPKLEYAAPIWHPYHESGEGAEDSCQVDLQEMEEHQ